MARYTLGDCTVEILEERIELYFKTTRRVFNAFLQDPPDLSDKFNGMDPVDRKVVVWSMAYIPVQLGQSYSPMLYARALGSRMEAVTEEMEVERAKAFLKMLKTGARSRKLWQFKNFRTMRQYALELLRPAVPAVHEYEREVGGT